LSIALVAAEGCKKQITAKAPTAPPVAPAPTAQISATPNAVSAGDKAVLSWSTTNARNISIDGVGTVPASGTKTITPATSSNYHLVARGEGGTAEADARVTVAPRPAVAQQAPSTMSEEQEFRANVQDVFFDYDKSNLRSDAQASLTKDASFLSSHPNEKFLIGGYCDERGSNEYNLALGETRAETVKKALVDAGIARSRIRVVSYGKEKPFCSNETETCWQKNRRGGFTLDR
jgi:peptidoglycan-associated lipoprotein